MKTVIITRPQHQIESSRRVYEASGLAVFSAPCFELQSNPMVEPDWLHLPADVWVILSVPALQHALLLAPSWQPPATARVIGVGPAVEQAWEAHFTQPIETHPLMNSEGVIALLQNPQPASVNILTTGAGRSLLKTHCLSAGISYTQINTYVRHPLALDVVGLRALYASEPPVLTATSVGILHQLMAQLDGALKDQVKASPLVVGAPRIADAAAELGFTQVFCADNPSDEAMCSQVVKII